MAKALVGRIVSVIDEKSVVVVVDSKVKHPLYKKYVSRVQRFSVDSSGFASLQLGMSVSFVSCRPVSKTKAHRVLSVA